MKEKRLVFPFPYAFLLPVFVVYGSLVRANEDIVSKGQKVFQTNCIACHGEKGDGKGVAAVAIKDRKPRNFIEGKFLYGSTDNDLFKTITQGVPGSAMPSWISLPEEDRRSVIQYIRKFKK